MLGDSPPSKDMLSQEKIGHLKQSASTSGWIEPQVLHPAVPLKYGHGHLSIQSLKVWV